MAIPFVFPFFFLSHLLVLLSVGQCCPESFYCGDKWPLLRFPFSNDSYPSCGPSIVNCGNHQDPTIEFQGGIPYQVKEILVNDSVVKLKAVWRSYLIKNKSCDAFFDLAIRNRTSISYSILSPTLTLFKCNTSSKAQRFPFGNYSHHCPDSTFTVYYSYPDQNNFVPSPVNIPLDCQIIHVPASDAKQRNASDIFSLMSGEFSVRLLVSNECLACHRKRGQCMNEPMVCQGGRKSHLTVILATVIPGVCITLVMAILILRYRKKWKEASSYNSSRNNSSDSKQDPEGGSFFLGVPVFSYPELEEATNYFDPSKELGDGGFGTVYHGKLRDGREVAVKRLYEHNYKRVTQFMNEIEILTRLRPKNLVTLYGCTSRQSRELLLVYEYIPNGTVADHLHGDRVKDGSLPWPIRLNIALETADALTYLHASEIIHRDVKTTNILLDGNFCVKVADFGLSRLFPTDITHVSTAPQGTPGYVDPEYHQCYQLTGKSDVYSFGVVLIELISSMPAVDISRHRHEINLANFALNKIHNRAFNELIDPLLGIDSDPRIERMVTSVAEVAFRCLQFEKEMRPTMDEVLVALREIHEFEDERNS